MRRGSSPSTKVILRTATILAAALVLNACGGDGTPKGAEGSTRPSTDLQGQSMDPCSGPLPTEHFDLDAAAEIPTLGADGQASTLGPEEAAIILGELTASADSMCALEVSPRIQEAIEAVRAAAAQGDRDEVRRLLEQLIRVDLQAAGSPIKSFRNSYAPEDRQKSRDASAAAAEAQAQGESDLAEEASEQARQHYTNYATTAIPATDDVGALLTIAAEAQLLGLDDVAFDAIEKATEILEMELEEVAARYNPCRPTREEFRELATATARVQLIGGDASEGEILISETIDISIRRANGETVPECDALWSLAMTLDVESDTGDIAFLWDGVFSVTEGEIDGDGVGTLLGTGGCVVNGTTQQVFDVTGAFTFTMTGTFTGTDDDGQLNLRVESTEADVELDAEGSACEVIVDIVRVFLATVPTLPSLYHPEGLNIEVTDGVGASNVPVEPYNLEITVAQLGG